MSSKNKKRDEKQKAVLPPSGLAEDLILSIQSEDIPEAAGRQSERIYEFADSLQPVQIEEEKEKEQFQTWVTFQLGGEIFGLPVTHVQEILRVSTITRVPHAPYSVRGITNMRGRVLPVVDLRVRIGLSETPVSSHSRILVTGSRGRLIGLLVDSVQQVVRLDQRKIEPPPPDILTNRSDYILGVYELGNTLVILLEVDQILLLEEGQPQNRALLAEN